LENLEKLAAVTLKMKYSRKFILAQQLIYSI